jgi:hypothetical protein
MQIGPEDWLKNLQRAGRPKDGAVRAKSLGSGGDVGDHARERDDQRDHVGRAFVEVEGGSWQIPH